MERVWAAPAGSEGKSERGGQSGCAAAAQERLRGVASESREAAQGSGAGAGAAFSAERGHFDEEVSAQVAGLRARPGRGERHTG